MDLAFLTPLLDRPGPWASVYLDTSRATEDAAQRRALIDRAAVHRLAGLGVDDRTCAAVRERLAAEPAEGSPPGRALFAADGEVAVDTPLAGSPPDVAVTWAPLPHTAPLLGLLDDAVPRCLVVAVDRTGAELERRELGGAARMGTVEGRQWQSRGHRAPPADRHEWHYRHRVEDAWDRTAGIIADHLARVWPGSGAGLLVLTGDVRERRAVRELLPQQLWPDTVEVDGGGRADGIAREAFDQRIETAWNAHRTRHLDTVLNAFRTGIGRPGEHGTDATGTETAPGAAAQGVPAVVTAARQHQLAALLVQPSGHDPERPVWTGPQHEHISGPTCGPWASPSRSRHRRPTPCCAARPPSARRPCWCRRPSPARPAAWAPSCAGPPEPDHGAGGGHRSCTTASARRRIDNASGGQLRRPAMKMLERRYAVTLPGSIGGHAPPAVVVVHATEAVGPGGTLVWESVEGDLRVEITGEVATVLAAPAGVPQHPCLHAVPLSAGPLDIERTQASNPSRAMNP